MAMLKTFDLKGNKLSFANWISNLSPSDTPFASMIGKESIDQTMYSWQIDRLASPANPEIVEGSDFAAEVLAPTQVKSNFTQILRKVVRVTDTANKVGLYGRASEKAYQMEKAGKELKRDLEKAMLTQVAGDAGTRSAPRRFAGFVGLVADEGLPCRDTGAVVHKTHQAKANDPAFGKVEIFDLTYNLYLAGSKANKIMAHPKHMHIFSSFIGGDGQAHRVFKNVDDKFNMYVKSFRDPLGQVFEIIPNRFMPEDKLFFFTESDWTQMILREPKSEELARNGSSERHMIEMEVGLRHKNPYASGVLKLVPAAGGTDVKALVATLSHDSISVAGGTAPTQTKLKVTAYKNGAVDTTMADATADDKLTVTITPASGIAAPTLTWEAGKGTASVDISAAAVAGVFVVKVDRADGISTSVELNIHSKDLRSAVTLEEPVVEEVVVEAPKARKARAKAE